MAAQQAMSHKISIGVRGELAASVSNAQSTTSPEQLKKIAAATANFVAIENLALRNSNKNHPPMYSLQHTSTQRVRCKIIIIT